MELRDFRSTQWQGGTSPKPELLAPVDVARDYGIPETTQAVWRCVNRYDFRRLVLKAGRSVKYRRGELEAWLESRRLVVEDEIRSLGTKEVA